jgi:ketosteroid isomerase-like protein
MRDVGRSSANLRRSTQTVESLTISDHNSFNLPKAATLTEDINDISVLIREFWALMGSNDFGSVQAVLGEQFILDWPQSNERIRGAARFAQMNAEYPAQGPWRFTVNRVVANTVSEAVSDVTVTDGSMTARAISFFSVEAGKINRIVEYWPESYAAPVNRAHLVERIG